MLISFSSPPRLLPPTLALSFHLMFSLQRARDARHVVTGPVFPPPVCTLCRILESVAAPQFRPDLTFATRASFRFPARVQHLNFFPLLPLNLRTELDFGPRPATALPKSRYCSQLNLSLFFRWNLTVRVFLSPLASPFYFRKGQFSVQNSFSLLVVLWQNHPRHFQPHRTPQLRHPPWLSFSFFPFFLLYSAP